MNEDSVRYAGWRVVGGAGMGAFCMSAFVFTFAVLLRSFTDEFSWSREAVSGAFGVMTLAGALPAPLVGHAVDRYGPQWIAAPCLLVAAAAFASLALLTPHVWHLYAVYAAIGVASAGTSPPVYSRVVSTWFDRRRGAALALVIASIGVAAILLPPATLALVAAVGWRRACLAVALVIIGVGVPLVGRYVREPRVHDPRPPLRGPSTSVRQAVRSRVFWTLLIVVFGTTVALNGVVVHLSPLLVDRGLPPTLAVLVMSVMGGASLVGRLSTGWLLDRFNATRVSCTLLTIAALGAYLLADVRSVGIAVTAAACIGLGTGGEVDVIPYLLSRYFGVQSLATLFGMLWMAFGVAGVAGPMWMGRAFDATGSYEDVLVGLAIGVLTAAALMLTLPPYRSPAMDAAVDVRAV